ncbi:uncharacterized protein LOC113212092 [Frankliniella occidentalis]|uniref:Uncharacterized protein LOC113212092 n=1 Tax=Frankliniella occidentalis TaxID=133901 RepID=A0A9C6U5V5_FRAOC|nr:uncharacterized protein LOC113212092 [Frankliniella occidentalis]
MECDICTDLFDGAERAPKVLPCGHTACLQCLRRLQDSKCPTCRQIFTGPSEGLPTNFLALKLPEGIRLDRSPLGWCSGCRAAATPRCWEDHGVVSVRGALRRQLQDALPQAAEQLQVLQDKCRDEQALPALTLLTGESWAVSLRGGGRELTCTVRNTEEPLTKALWLLLAARAALTEDPPPAPPSASAAHSAAAPPAAAPPALVPHAAATPAAATPAAATPAAATPAAAPPAAAPPAAAPAASLGGRDAPEARPLGVMDVGITSCSLADELQQEKAVALRDAAEVSRLVSVYCNADPAWSLELLQRASPSVEWLSVYNPRVAHLRAVHAMPRLRGLEVRCEDVVFESPSLTLPDLPPGHHAGLRWLRVHRLPRHTLMTLLQAHGHSLEELHLWVSTRGNIVWPHTCCDLRLLLQECDLRALRRLVLSRVHTLHEADQCDRQRAEVRVVLPGAVVLCDRCDGVAVDAVEDL